MKETRVHVACVGNLFRSRLAEAYLKSKQLPNIKVSSSGSEATIQHKGPIYWGTLRLLQRNDLLPFMSMMWKQTTEDDLKDVDMVIFMEKANFEFCQQWISPKTKYEIWNIPDFNDKYLDNKPFDQKKEIEYMIMSEDIFAEIIEKVDQLILTLS